MTLGSFIVNCSLQNMDKHPRRKRRKRRNGGSVCHGEVQHLHKNKQRPTTQPQRCDVEMQYTIWNNDYYNMMTVKVCTYVCPYEWK
eukprot:m.228499 g.228499  ORF g.228499 m.228499 type:complete len:86 (-) comp13878_c2_seq2:751-1008(-)